MKTNTSTQFTDYTQPTPLVKNALANIPPGRALDIGSYAGRNALYLVHLGWEVTAIDTDAIALNTLQATAARGNLKITTRQADVRNYQPKDQFDAILCLMVLHFLPEQDIAPTIAKMQEWTKPQGTNIVTAFTDGNLPGTRPYLFPSGRLKELYKSWHITSYEETYSSWIIPEGKTEPERYMVARLVAEKKK
ncbi:MAG TPA: methyltransferase domain-containing protein [Candidatus Saccharimonas sp.]|nr:methyltransferase domain-containing protein [Candidatus Saccharimonas sp.]